MKWFTNHRLIKEQDGYTLVLFLDKQLSEFAKDFDKIQDSDRQNIEKGIQEYIKAKLPGIKVKTVKIMLGSLLIASLPFTSATAETTYGTGAGTMQVGQVSTYIVKYGDTLFKIAQKFGVTVNQLKSENGLSGDLIIAGQQLRIPFQQGTYTIKYGDTLFKIATKFGTTVKRLKEINGLTGDLIYSGQKLKIPVQQYLDYTVRSGDTLYGISTRFKTNVEQLRQINGLQGYEILEGQVLKVPSHASSTIVQNPEDILVLANKNSRLPSQYVPDNLVVPDVPFTFEEYHSKKLMRKEAAAALEELFRQAKQDGIDLYAISGYRSYERQEAIFALKVMERGMDVANQTSAKPGESEHQTGLAMDVTSPSVNYLLTQYFGQTREGKWLAQNAHRFGFIIRYPKGKEHITGYSYEPWHIRYVGKDSALHIAKSNITLEEYV
ncbi:MAG: LysM peptidoglycan-binding domain-containing protein [Acetivibrionales bacterium]|jgi:LAS superfamily LD-carboxypeptidase LdcB